MLMHRWQWLSQESTNMLTRQELILQFMISLAANSNVHHTDIMRIANALAHEYLESLG